MTLSLDQLRAVAKLARARQHLLQAQDLYSQAENECWEMGVSDRQVGAVSGCTGNAVYMRRKARLVKAEAETAGLVVTS